MFSFTKTNLQWCLSSCVFHWYPQPLNTLRPRQNGRYVADDIFKCIFLNENVWISLKISLKFVPKVRINNIPALVLIMAWRRPGGKPLSEPIMVSLLTHIYASLGLNELRGFEPMNITNFSKHINTINLFWWIGHCLKFILLPMINLSLSITHLRLVMPCGITANIIWCPKTFVNIASGHGKPWPEPMLKNYEWGLMAFS